tara:strand:+ start:451 stop:600 length:150 start_codon:yes stop_codon:yes gene_type:complete
MTTLFLILALVFSTLLILMTFLFPDNKAEHYENSSSETIKEVIDKSGEM